MKKFLLVVFIGVVLALDLYGIIGEINNEPIKEIDHIKDTTTMVYVE